MKAGWPLLASALYPSYFIISRIKTQSRGQREVIRYRDWRWGQLCVWGCTHRNRLVFACVQCLYYIVIFFSFGLPFNSSSGDIYLWKIDTEHVPKISPCVIFPHRPASTLILQNGPYLTFPKCFPNPSTISLTFDLFTCVNSFLSAWHTFSPPSYFCLHWGEVICHLIKWLTQTSSLVCWVFNPVPNRSTITGDFIFNN